MRWIFLFLPIWLAVTGCASTCPEVRQQLKACHQSVIERDQVIGKKQAVIEEKEQTIEDKNETIATLKGQIDELDRRLNILTSEQNRYDERIQRLTSEVRDFVKMQIQENRRFLTNVALEDFVGNPLILRENVAKAGHMIVDMAHPVPGKGQINGIGGYFQGSGEICVKLLRPVGSDYIVTYSKALRVECSKTCKLLIDFDKPILVNKGDVVAYYLPGPVSVVYDREIGVNSYFEVHTDKYPVGERIKADDMWQPKQSKRKYSLNYYGIFIQGE